MTSPDMALREALSAWRRQEVQMLGAAISIRNWHDLESAYNQLRDKMDRALTDAALSAKQGADKPIDMLLFCPKCGIQHVDEPDERTPDWSNPPHRSHLCHGCGCIWRPADVPTNGVVRIATVGKADAWGESNSAALALPPSSGAAQPTTIAAAFAQQSAPAEAGEPVAWRVKDFADGWILFHSEARARHEAEVSGALIQPLYATPGTSIGREDELREALTKLATKQEGYGMAYHARGVGSRPEIHLYGDRAQAAHWLMNYGLAALSARTATPGANAAADGEQVLVPREPTEAMLAAVSFLLPRIAREYWAAMLAASPPQTEEEEGK